MAQLLEDSLGYESDTDALDTLIDASQRSGQSVAEFVRGSPLDFVGQSRRYFTLSDFPDFTFGRV